MVGYIFGSSLLLFGLDGWINLCSFESVDNSAC